MTRELTVLVVEVGFEEFIRAFAPAFVFGESFSTSRFRLEAVGDGTVGNLIAVVKIWVQIPDFDQLPIRSAITCHYKQLDPHGLLHLFNCILHFQPELLLRISVDTLMEHNK